MDKNIIFLHLPKNAGTTFYRILNRYFSSSETFQVGYNENNIWNLDEFTQLPESKRANIHLLAGHFMFGLHRYLPGASDYITFLRKPIARTISFYNYVRRDVHNRLHDEVGPKTLYEFVTQVKDYDVVNGQIRKLSGINSGEDEMLQLALENIENHFSFVGLQEKFDESLVVLGNLYNWKRLYYKEENVSKTGIKISDVDQRTIDAIKELNGGDIKLYEIMEKRFNEKFARIPFAEIKCASLQMTNQLYSHIK